MKLLVVEENAENFLPMALTRATYELRYGVLCPLDRALLQTKDVALKCRPHLAPYLRARTGLPVNEDIIDEVERDIAPGLPALAPWEILSQSDKLIAADFGLWNELHRNVRGAISWRGVHIIGDASQIHVGAGAVVQPGCVLDVSGGPIILAEGAQVKWSQIQGPVFVGPLCTIDGARLRPGTSLGPNCKVGGEVSATIFQSRVNKSHEGFVGHTWASRWVNFGAGATTSNLKNTYGTIRFQRDVQTPVETGVQFLGSLIGDHTKIGIGQYLTTGSHIGACCNIFGGGVAPKYIPSFSWGGLAGWQEYRFESCIKTVQATLARRNAVLRPESQDVLHHVFETMRGERETAWKL
jgi:UDP-N-acetylglucosamine diphosphorylase/glucosamine-1-phosphate N-acetyltransferase